MTIVKGRLARLIPVIELTRTGRVIKPSEEVDLGQLTQEGLQTLDVLIRSKEITVNVSPDFPTMYGDHILRREVLENLIENAAKYPEGQEKHDFTVSMFSAARPNQVGVYGILTHR